MIQDAEDFEHGIVVAARACGGVGIAAALHDSVLENLEVACFVVAYAIGARGRAVFVECISVVYVYFVGVCVVRSLETRILAYVIFFEIRFKFVFEAFGASKVQVAKQAPVALTVVLLKECLNLLEITFSEFNILWTFVCMEMSANEDEWSTKFL